jgi:hypothetical protein
MMFNIQSHSSDVAQYNAFEGGHWYVPEGLIVHGAPASNAASGNERYT